MVAGDRLAETIRQWCPARRNGLSSLQMTPYTARSTATAVMMNPTLRARRRGRSEKPTIRAADQAKVRNVHRKVRIGQSTQETIEDLG